MDASQCIGSVTRADGVTSNANQAAAHCGTGQAAISDGNDGLIVDDVSEPASTSECPVSVSECQLSDANVLGDFDICMC